MQVLATSSYGMQRVIEIMDHGSLVLSDEESLEAHDCLQLHLKAYFWLAAYFYQKRILLFKVRCKTHYLFHVASDILELKLNPALFQTFEEESFLGKIKAIALHCHGGTCTDRLFLRYILCLANCLANFKKTESRLE